MTRTAEVVSVYGVVPAEAAAGMSEFDLVVHGPVAAVIGGIRPDHRLTAEDLRTHDAVVAAFVRAGIPILPMRFGSAVAGRETIAEQVLAPKAQAFEAALADLAGHVQYTLKIRYDEDGVLRRVVRDDPAVARARAAVASRRGNDRGAQIQLGRLVAAAIAQRRPADAGVIRSALVPLVRTVRSTVAEDAWGVADLACLVATNHEDQFLAAAEQLAERHAELVRMRLLGPAAPYDFVPEL